MFNRAKSGIGSNYSNYCASDIDFTSRNMIAYQKHVAPSPLLDAESFVNVAKR